MAQTKENNPAPRAKAPAAPKAAAANGTAPAGEKHTRPTTRRPYYNRRPRRAQQPKEAATPIHIYPLGGLGEVGKNMTVYECNGDMIIVDCGLVFPDSEMFGVDMVIPDFTFVVQNKDKIKGLLITHGHEDHIGSIPYLLQKFDLPIYGTRLTCGLIRNKLEEFGLAGKTKFVEITPKQKIKLGCFTVEPIHVNHSIPDAVAFAIDSPAGTIIQTGDFKIDYTPLACGVTDLSTLSEYGQRGVLALLSDSTNAERPGFTATEQKVAAGVRSLFARARNKRIIIATFASNIYRVQQIIDLAVEDGRKVAFSGRSMVNNTAMAQELGYMHIPEGTLISVDELNQYPPEQVVLVTTGSQGEPLSALSRMASCSHRQVRVGPGDFIIISANPIPGNEKSVTKIVNGLLLLGAEVIYESMYDVHVSGHACQEEQKLMLTLTKPKYFLPVHGEYKQLKKHALTAASLGIPTSNILIAENGSNVILSQDEMKLGEPVTAGQLKAVGAMAALLKDAIKPNLIQTLEHTPALVHGGPFANIAHGCNSVRATKAAMKMADYCITEAGFGADLGAEKFFDIKCRKAGLTPDAVVLVATIRALKYNGGVAKADLGAENLEALKKGIVNLEKHIENLQKYGVPVVVTLNSFITDSEAETAYVREFCETRGCEFALSEVWEKGGEGGIALAEKVLKAIDEKENHFHVLYENELSLQDKIKKIAQEIYGASDVVFAPAAAKQLKRLTELGFGDLPVCMAKNQYSLSDDPTLLGRPSGFELNVREVYVSAGAGFVVVLTGAVMTMPGLPKAPAAYNIDVDDSGRIVGLF